MLSGKLLTCAAIAVGLASSSSAQVGGPACPAPVSKGSILVSVTGLEKEGGKLSLGLLVRNDFNVPMNIYAYNWGNDVSRAYDSNGIEWPVDKSASRQARWAQSSGQAIEPKRSTESTLIFTKLTGSVASERFDFTLNFSTLPAGAPGSGLGRTQMVKIKLQDVPVGCSA